MMNKDIILELADMAVEKVQNRPNGTCDMNKYNVEFGRLILEKAIKACPHEDGRNHIRQAFGVTMKSDFPEFQQRYETLLLPENPDRFDILASQANFTIYHHDLWNGVAKRFSEMIAAECAAICDERARSAPMGSDEQCEAEDCANAIKEHFKLT